jgi:inhibitor of cysteine peptidase
MLAAWVMIVAASGGMPACAGPASQAERKEKDVLPALVLTRQDSGRTVAVHPGDTVSISLPENPSTGYRWLLERSNEEVLLPVGARYVHGDGAPGRGGERIWTFAAAGEGKARLSLALRRPWEKNASAADRFEITVLSSR